MRAGLAALALLTAVHPALAADTACERRISVIGRAQATRAPDFAAVTLGIEAKAPDAAAAVDAASKAVTGILALAREFGVPEADIGTAALSLSEATRDVTRPNGTMASEPDGYRASNTVTIRLGDMARLGDLLRRSLKAGANRIEGIGFGLRDPDAAQAELEIAAAQDARKRATALAEAAGVALGPLCTLTAGRASEPGPVQVFRSSMAAKAGARPVPIAAGTIPTGAEVSAVFAVTP